MAMSPDELEKTVLELKDKIDGILNTVAESEKNYKRGKDLEAWGANHGEALNKYSDKLKKLNGDDFDLMSASFDEYHNDFSDIEEDTYVAQLVAEIDNKIAALKDALNDEEVEIKSDEDTTEVKTEDTEIETPAEEPKAEDDSEEKEVEEEKADDEEAAEDTESEDDELAALQKQLDEDYEKYHKE